MPLYELEEGTSRKFYRIELHGARVHLHWGRIGTEGEHQVIALENEAAARAEYQRQIDRRKERGYRLVVDEDVPHDLADLEKARLARTGALSSSPRFLFVQPTKKRFAWVEARGTELVHAQGPASEEASTVPTTKLCMTPQHAIRERDALVAKLLRQGYELDTFGAKEPPKTRTTKTLASNEQLERAVAEDPTDEGAWGVLEDWLLQQEDPRGELVRLDKAKQRGDEAQARGAALPLLLGPKHAAIGRAIETGTWRAGYLVECTWRDPPRNAAAIAQAFYAAPAVRLLQQLELHLPTLDRITPHVEAIASQPCRSALRSIRLEGALDLPMSPLPAKRLAEIEHLDALHVGSPWCTLVGAAALPMRSLVLVVGDREVLESWLACTFPRLRTWRLELGGLGEIDRPETRDGIDLAPLLDGTRTPVLESLTIACNATVTAEALLRALGDSALRQRARIVVSEFGRQHVLEAP